MYVLNKTAKQLTVVIQSVDTLGNYMETIVNILNSSLSLMKSKLRESILNFVYFIVDKYEEVEVE